MKARLLAPFAPNLAKLAICTAIAGGVILSGQLYAAVDDDTIRIGFISPRTGPLASFGKTDGFILKQARQALASGMTVGGKHYQVEIIDLLGTFVGSCEVLLL